MAWKLHNLLEYERRQQKPAIHRAPREADLHGQIEEYLRARGIWYWHSRMDRRATGPKGTPDFIIAAHNGRTVYVECKRKGGKLRIEQRATAMQLMKFGHEYHCIDNYADFLTAMET